MKKICFFVGDIQGNGGISRVTWILGNRLCNSQYVVHVLANWKSEKEKYVYNEKVFLAHLFNTKESNFKRFLPLISGIRKYVIKNNIDILVCAGEIYYPVCVLALIGLKTKLICWEHSNVSVTSEHRMQGLCRRIGAKNADLIVAITKKDASLFKEKYKINNVKTIYNPVDDKLMGTVKYDTQSKRIISVGRLCFQKNFEILVDVANLVLKKHEDWFWDIYGEGENRESIQNKIDQYNLNSQLKLCGRVDDLYERYPQYSMLVMTSRFEGFPMTLLEATASGLPQVSFDILTGPNEIIDDNKTGFLVCKDDVQGMAGKIEELILNSDMRKIMSDNCINKRERYSCGEILSLWEETLANID